jgi:tetratricopeptide (TPR) repeat protein
VAYSDAGESEAKKALAGFEGIRSVFGRIFPGVRVDPPKPMVIFVVEDEASMKRLVPKPFEGKDPKRPAGMFYQREDRNDAILRLDVNHQTDQPYFVLFHEYTHSIVHQNFSALPTWLDEGLADFYGATEIRSEHIYLGRIPVGRLTLLRNHVRLPLETLFTVTHDSPHYQEGEKAGIFYAQSWAFVHYLFMDDQALKAGLFRNYLKAMSGGADPLAAARAGFGDLGKLQGALTTYSQRSRFVFWDFPLTVTLTDRDFQVRVLDEADSWVARAEFLMDTGEERLARPLLDQAVAAAVQRPEVQVALGRSMLLRGETGKAETAYREALRLGTQDFRAPFRLAQLVRERDNRDSAEIIAWLEMAKRLRPDFPGTYMALCQQYSWNPKDPDKALQAGRKAVELEPQNLSSLFNLGIVCMNLGLEKEAEEVGGQLASFALTQAEKRMAATYAASLDRFRAQRHARNDEPPVEVPGPVEAKDLPARPVSIEPLKFWLPDTLAGLSREVQAAVMQGRLDEAIELVKAAIPKAKGPYEKPSLKALLDHLKARKAKH